VHDVQLMLARTQSTAHTTSYIAALPVLFSFRVDRQQIDKPVDMIRMRCPCLFVPL